jgi:hypothetical protein
VAPWWWWLSPFHSGPPPYWVDCCWHGVKHDWWSISFLRGWFSHLPWWADPDDACWYPDKHFR